MPGTKTAVVTGASAGIGEATALALAADGWQVVCAARRLERVQDVARRCGHGATAVRLDVTDQASVDQFAGTVDTLDLLVNNAGGARGLRPIAEAEPAEWEWMFQANVLGTVRLTKALIPALAKAKGLVVNVASIAGHKPYPGGAGYNAAKFAQSALTRVLRQELAQARVGVSEIDPGLVKTDFSLMRFGGDQARADAVYQGVTPLTAQDVAEAIAWVASRPPRVNIDLLSILPRTQVQDGPLTTLPDLP
jgi:NADP-dependent 3-hydroxy acid dehydrogenase YdfG